MGTTIFEVHLHPEWPCERCRITGTNLISTDIERAGHRPDTEADSKESWTSSNGGMGSTLQNTKSSLEKARLIELRRLKKRILDTSDESQNSSSNAPRTKYVDRAAIRRSLYKDTESSHRETLWDEGRESAEHDYMASSANSVRNVSSKCSSDLDSTIQQPNSESTGSKILKKMGWTEGQGLGAKGSGTTEPVSVTMRVGRAGLGSSQPLPSSVPAQKADCRYSRGWIADQAESISEVTKRRARERFYNI